MAICKFCGKPVLAGPTMHRECWEEETEKVAEIFCDSYCRWPLECQSQEELEAHCDSCQLIALVNLGGRGENK